MNTSTNLSNIVALGNSAGMIFQGDQTDRAQPGSGGIAAAHAGEAPMKWLDTVTGGYASLIKYAAIGLIIAAAFGYTYHLGSSHTAAVWSAKYEKREAEIATATAAEISRQAQANAQAKAAEEARIAQLEAKNAALEKTIKEKSDEADADPDRDRPALSSSARMRIDSIH